MATVPSLPPKEPAGLRLYRPADERRAELMRRGRAAVLWGLLFFVAGQAGLVLVQRERPQLRDPEYGTKLWNLKRQLAEYPDRPLVLVLGSSRVNMGFCPEALAPCRTADGREALVFNLGINSGGPLHELVCLRRLLRQGIRPEWVLAEYWIPMNIPWQGDTELSRLSPGRQELGDLPLLQEYADRPAKLYRDWCAVNLTPWFSSRFVLLSTYLRSWVPLITWLGILPGPIDPFGWGPFDPHFSEADHQKRLAELRARPDSIWTRDGSCISQTSLRALRELLDLCRREGIKSALLYMPEGPTSRACYPPSVLDETDQLLSRLGKEYGAPLIDCRAWSPEEDFWDSAHFYPEAARRFTERFGREALQPLLAGRD